jgi:uracil-DNA glycosylase family 4
MNRHPQSDVIWQTIRNPQCTNCDLCQSAQTVCLLGDGPVPCEAMAIGEGPGSREDDVEIPFSGKSGIFMRRCMKEVGIDPRQVYITNVVACRPPANRTPTRQEAKICSSLYLNPQVDRVKPKVILLLGNTAISYVTGRKATVTKMEGSTFTFQRNDSALEAKIICVPSRHPSSVIRLEDIDAKQYAYAVQIFKQNLMLFKRMLSPEPDAGIKYKKEPIKLDEKIPYVYTDLESNGLDPFRPDAKIWCEGFTQDAENVCAFEHTVESPIETEYRSTYMKQVLTGFPIIAHRTTFEGTWYRRHYGITPRIYHDTKLCSYIINENEPSGLKHQAVTHLNVEPWDEGQDFENPDLTKLLPYNARDNKYGMRLYRERDLPFLKKYPKVARLMRYILLPAAEVLTEMICNGFHIDEKLAKIRLDICEKKKKEINDKINRFAGKEVNPGSPKQMVWLLYEHIGLECPVFTGKGKKSTSEAARIRLKGQHKVISLLDEWHKWEKYESTYITPWLRKGPVLHANYDETGTDTGRLSSSMVKNKRHEKKLGAVIHQCPRDPFVRTLISPRGYLPDPFSDRPPVKAHPEDWCVVAGDLSQIELRLVAHSADEPTMIEVFNDPDGDIHLSTAMTLIKGEITKELRKRAKAVNFGFVYGMWWKKFIAYALEKYDLKLSAKEGQDYRKKFFRKYSGLLAWHRRVIAFVNRNGWIDSLIGRRRHLPSARIRGPQVCFDCKGEAPANCFGCGGAGFTDGNVDEWVRKEAERQAINSPIQGMASDLMLLILALLCSYSLPWKVKIDRQKAFPIGTAHDSGLFECHKSYAQELKEQILWTVKNLPLKKFFNLEMKVPILMDVSIYDDHWEWDEEVAEKLGMKVTDLKRLNA